VALWAAFGTEAGALGPAARRRAVRRVARAAPAAVVLGVAALAARGAFARAPLDGIGRLALLALAAALAGACWRVARAAAAARPSTAGGQLELAALAILAAVVAGQLGEAALRRGDAPLQPLVYLAICAVAAALRWQVAVAAGALAIALDALAWRARGADPAGLGAVAAHAALTVAFGALARGVLGARLAAATLAERAAVAGRLREIDERARACRLLGRPADAVDEEARRRADAATAVQLEAALGGLLELARAALDAHTAAVFLASDDGRELRLQECRSASDAVHRGPLPAGEGALGAALRSGAPVRLAGPRCGAWYDDGTRPATAIVVPLLDRSGRARGVAVADRLAGPALEAREERVLQAIAAEVVRTAEAERLLADARRSRDESERFYQAIERLNRNAKPAEVFDALLELASGWAPVDFGAVTLVEGAPGAPRHRVARVLAGGEPARALEGLEFADDTGLVASVVRLGSPLPIREVDPARTPVLGDGRCLAGLASLKVVPLRAGGRVLGTLVLGSRRRGAYAADAVRQLEVFAMQAGDAILRARLFDETERLATTDGLTGLLNHRAFQARLDEQLAQASRYGRPLALLFCDVDHFKRVNDTHGHPVGDDVLRGIARVLAREARASDAVARWGGEEFAILLPETDAAGGLAIAERIRERIAAAAVPTAGGPLAVTVSVGVASMPANGRAKGPLVEAADRALYAAKRGGRNGVRAAGSAC
jgi:diguanylate cyclase (GGDEF)-like protein